MLQTSAVERLLDQARRAGFRSIPAWLASACPRDGQKLPSVLRTIAKSLVNLCDHVRDKDLRQFRDGTLYLQANLARERGVQDTASSSFFRNREIPPAYRVLANPPKGIWTTEILVSATSAAIAKSMAGHEVNADALANLLLSGIPPLPSLDPAEENPLIQIHLLAIGIKKSHKKESAALLDLLDLLQAEDPSVHDLAPNVQNLKQMADYSLEKSESSLNNKDKLKRLAHQIGVSEIQARRQAHRPPIQSIPSPRVLSHTLGWLKTLAEPQRLAIEAMILLGEAGKALVDVSARSSSLLPAGVGDHLRIDVTLPEFKEARLVQGAGFELVERHYSLPIPVSIARRLEKHRLDLESKKFMQEIRYLLRDRTQPLAHNLSVRALTKIFEWEVGFGRLDPTLMCILNGEKPNGREAGPHYFSPNVATLIKHYRATTERLASRFNLATVLEEGWTSVPDGIDRYVGYSHRPNAEALRAHIEELKRLATRRRGHSRDIRSDNAFIGYTALMYLCASAIRPTGTVLPNPRDVSCKDATVLASEKDSLFYRSTRLIPLPRCVIKQFEYLDQRRSARRLRVDEPATLIMPNDLSAAPTPDRISEALELDHPWRWPNDTFRHYARSRAWELGCTAAALRTLLGHFPRHAAPDITYRATPILHELREQTEATILKILDELGFEPLR
jgi:hypothetical protein